MIDFDIVIIGAGLYVCGKGTPDYGTVLPAILEWKRLNNWGGTVHCASTSVESALEFSKKVKELAAKTGVNASIKQYPSEGGRNPNTYKQVLRSIKKPACAIVVVPDHLHFQVASDCLRAGLHTLLVKPLTPTVDEGRGLVNLADQLGLYGAVEFHKRWDKSNLLLRDKLNSGSLGNLVTCWIEYSQRKSIPLNSFKDWSARTTILQYLGVHYIDVIRFVTRGVPKRVMAVAQKGEIAQAGIDTPDAIQTVVEWELPNGHLFTQILLTSWLDLESSSAMSDQKIKVLGTKGRYEADQKERGIVMDSEQSGIEHINPDFCRPFGTEDGSVRWQGYGIDSITTFLSDVLGLERGVVSIESLEKERPTFRESLISTSVLEAAHLSLESHSDWQQIDSLAGII